MDGPRGVPMLHQPLQRQVVEATLASGQVDGLIALGSPQADAREGVVTCAQIKVPCQELEGGEGAAQGAEAELRDYLAVTDLRVGVKLDI